LVWFDTEYPNLLAAQHAAADKAWHAVVWQLAWTLTTFQRRQGLRHDQLAVWRAALDAAAHLSDPTTRTIAHQFIGRSYVNLGCTEDGRGHLHQALTLAEAQNDVGRQAHTHQMLTRAREAQGDNWGALQHATSARDLFCALNQPVWEADALTAMGRCAAQLGEYDTAHAYCQAALTLHREHKHPEGEANTLDCLGYIDYHTGHHQRAIRSYRQALTLYRTLGNTYEIADSLHLLGHPYVVLGAHEQARLVWREALDLYQQMGRDADAARVQQQLDNCTDHNGTTRVTE
jgi:tetratricopeptide (TPR) repeat protein